ncbi:histidine kinase [Streptomyces sp. HSW2009]|uniref:sensor histidine kinase n=1 Tax=Streptomyces sp. HSW2009 TaxID=3142890 RepID=UPI0032EF85AF
MSVLGGAQEWTPGGPYPIRLVHRVVQGVRAVDAARPALWDALLTAVFGLGACVDVGGGNWRHIAHSDTVPVALVAALAAGFVLALWWHRRRPLAAFVAMAVLGLVDAWVGTRLQVGQLGQLVVLFHVALRLPGRALTVAGALVVVQSAVGATRWPTGDWGQAFLPTVTAGLVAALLGSVVRSRRDYTAALVERARQLEVERDQQAQLAAAAERTRIAREMHDIIGHHLSVITGLADGGSYAAHKRPERAAQALAAIGATSRQALDELRRLLGVLRDDHADPPPGPELGPQPTLADLGALIDRVRAAGLPVRLTEHGTPAPGPPGRELTVYRVVQEALTNTLKHAGPRATATVEVHHAPRALSVTVTDAGRTSSRTSMGTGTGTGTSTRAGADTAAGRTDLVRTRTGPGTRAGAGRDAQTGTDPGRVTRAGAGTGPDAVRGGNPPDPYDPPSPSDGAPAAPHPGRGLRGLRERAALYDGTLTAGPGPAGGGTVRLELPTPGTTPPPTAATPLPEPTHPTKPLPPGPPGGSPRGSGAAS